MGLILTALGVLVAILAWQLPKSPALRQEQSLE
jgi:hypothetical protein